MVRRSTSTILAALATLITFTYSRQRGHQTLSPRTIGGCNSVINPCTPSCEYSIRPLFCADLLLEHAVCPFSNNFFCLQEMELDLQELRLVAYEIRSRTSGG